MSSRSKRPRIAWMIATSLAAIALALLLIPDAAKPGDPQQARTRDTRAKTDRGPAAEADPSPDARTDWDQQTAGVRAGTPEERLEAWQNLRAELLAAPIAESTAFISAFLASGERVPMGLTFVVGRDGTLLAAPDLRTLLLDVLDTINPEQADREARRILTTPDDPDDWAISLRIVSRLAPPDNPYMEGRVLELLRVESWLEDPQIGTLQAYDAAVYVEDPAVTRRLLEIAESAHPPPTRFAARLALERKAETQFAIVGPLIAAPKALAGQPELRATLMARADVRSSVERETLEAYLLTLPNFEDEAVAFARWFPNYNQQISDNLITKDRLTPIEDRMAQDRATLAWIREIRGQPGFSETQELLDTIEDRLNNYLTETSETGNDP